MAASQQYLMTPGAYGAGEDAKDRAMKIALWRAERADRETARRDAEAYRIKQEEKAEKAKGIGSLFKIGGAVGGGLLGAALAPATGGASMVLPALAGAGIGSELGGASAGFAGGDASSNLPGAISSGAALMNSAKPAAAPPATSTPTPEDPIFAPTEGNTNYTLSTPEDEEDFKKWLESQSGDPQSEGY